MFRFFGNKFQLYGNKLITIGENMIPKTEFKTQLQKSLEVIPNHKSFPSAAFVAPNARINGEVTIGPDSALWYNTKINSESQISIGSQSIIGDCSVLQATSAPTSIGNRVVIGANTEIHSCTIEDECIIGDNVKILNGAIIKKHTIIASGTVVNENQEVSGESLWAGNPAQVVRALESTEILQIVSKACEQIAVAQGHNAEHLLTDEEVIDRELWFEEQAYRDPDTEEFKPFSKVNTDVDDLSEYGRGLIVPRVFVTDFEKKDILPEK